MIVLILFGILVVVAGAVGFYFWRRQHNLALTYVKSNSRRYKKLLELLENYDLTGKIDYQTHQDILYHIRGDRHKYNKYKSGNLKVIRDVVMTEVPKFPQYYNLWDYQRRGLNEFNQRWSKYLENHNSQFNTAVKYSGAKLSPRLLRSVEKKVLKLESSMNLDPFDVKLVIDYVSPQARRHSDFKLYYKDADTLKLIPENLVLDSKKFPIEIRRERLQARSRHVASEKKELLHNAKIHQIKEQKKQQALAKTRPAKVLKAAEPLHIVSMGRKDKRPLASSVELVTDRRPKSKPVKLRNGMNQFKRDLQRYELDMHPDLLLEDVGHEIHNGFEKRLIQLPEKYVTALNDLPFYSINLYTKLRVGSLIDKFKSSNLSTIYIVYNKTKNLVYVGQARNGFHSRFKEHFKAYGHSIDGHHSSTDGSFLWSRDFMKDDDLYFSFINLNDVVYNPGFATLDELERFFIYAFKSNELGYGYNKTRGNGDLVIPMAS